MWRIYISTLSAHHPSILYRPDLKLDGKFHQKNDQEHKREDRSQFQKQKIKCRPYSFSEKKIVIINKQIKVQEYKARFRFHATLRKVVHVCPRRIPTRSTAALCSSLCGLNSSLCFRWSNYITFKNVYTSSLFQKRLFNSVTNCLNIIIFSPYNDPLLWSCSFISVIVSFLNRTFCMS